MLHPPSSTLVASPWVRFGEAGEAESAKLAEPAGEASAAGAAARSLPGRCLGSAGASTSQRGSTTLSRFLSQAGSEEEEGAEEEAALLPGSTGDAANLACYTGGGGGLATASLKLDGSLVIAFKWDGHVYTATRRRMDSEQAQWALSWLQRHGAADQLQPGWTYLFEAVYRDNTHVVPYDFEGLVLLSAVSPDGHEVRDVATRCELAARLGTLAAPSVQGPRNELRARLGRGMEPPQGSNGGSGGDGGSSRAGGARQPRTAFAPPSFEGWVLEAAAGDGRRVKLVQADFKRAGATARQAMHPLVLWDAVRCGGKSRDSLAAGLPQHIRKELQAELDALTTCYCAARSLLAAALAQAQSGGSSSSSSYGSLGASISRVRSGSNAGAPSALRHSASPPSEEHISGLLASLSLEQHSKSSSSGGAGAAIGQEFMTQMAASEPFRAALRDALRVHSAEAGPMFLPPDYRRCPGPAPLLRGRLLACIQPGIDASLPGYTPSPAFAQTFVKGWQRDGPQGARGAFLAARAAGEPPAWAYGVGEVAWQVLPLLDGHTLVQAQLVCSDWRDLIQGDPTCQSAIQTAKEAHESERRTAAAAARHRFAYRLGSDSDGEYGGGYGSF